MTGHPIIAAMRESVGADIPDNPQFSNFQEVVDLLTKIAPRKPSYRAEGDYRRYVGLCSEFMTEDHTYGVYGSKAKLPEFAYDGIMQVIHDAKKEMVYEVPSERWYEDVIQQVFTCPYGEGGMAVGLYSGDCPLTSGIWIWLIPDDSAEGTP